MVEEKTFNFMELSKLNKDIKKGFKAIQMEDKNKTLIQIGQNIAAFSHDMKGKISLLDKLKNELNANLPEDKNKLFDEIIIGLEQATEDILDDYKENITSKIERIDLVEALEKMSANLSVLKNKKQYEINLSLKVKKGLKLDIKQSDFDRILFNLLTNAYDALPLEKGVIDINAEQIEDKVIIKVKDNGKGLENEELKKLGEIGYSTKESGTGIGLNSSLSIAKKKKKGSLEFDSSPDDGFTATLILNTSSKEPSTNYDECDMVILDDSELVRECVKLEAEEQNLRVSSFSKSELLLSQASRFSKNTVFLLDNFLRGDALSGIDVAKKLKAKGFKNIVFLTEDSEDKIKSEFPYTKGIFRKNVSLKSILAVIF